MTNVPVAGFIRAVTADDVPATPPPLEALFEQVRKRLADHQLAFVLMEGFICAEWKVGAEYRYAEGRTLPDVLTAILEQA